jgi:hypothetical protein
MFQQSFQNDYPILVYYLTASKKKCMTRKYAHESIILYEQILLKLIKLDFTFM